MVDTVLSTGAVRHHEPLKPPPRVPVVRTADLMTRGGTRAGAIRTVRAGPGVRLRRGVYSKDPVPEPTDAHLARVWASSGLLTDGEVFSHVSAALLHGLPVPWSAARAPVHVTLAGESGGNRRALRHVHRAPLPVRDRATVSGLPVTSLARTVVDCARTLDFVSGVAVADRALRSRTDPEAFRAELRSTARALAGFRGIGRAREVIAFADHRAENGGESRVRVLLDDLGIEPPEPQLRVEDPNDPGFVAYADFGWRDRWTLLEFDGALKYGADNPGGLRVAQVIIREKQREQRLQDLGWVVVRMVWDDLKFPDLVRERVLGGFDRAVRQRGGPPAGQSRGGFTA